MKIKKIILILIIVCVLVFVLTELLIIYVGNNDYKGDDIEYMIVLGAKANDDEPSLVLKYRLDKAFEYYKKNNDVIIIVSGGQGSDEVYSEAIVMKWYLVEKGIPKDQIIEETASTTTYENFKNIFSIIGKEKILVVTNDFHMFRSLSLAKQFGFDAHAFNAKTPKSIVLKMYIREFFAYYASLIGIK